MEIHFKLLSYFLTVLIIIISSGPNLSQSTRVFTIMNNCKETIWPAVTPGDTFKGSGFSLRPGQSIVFNAPVSWSGRIWGRTGCKFDKKGNGPCQTGACGTTLKCKVSGKPPASLAEFTLASDHDYYDVNLVDGFNLPMTITPINGKGNCSVSGCDKDLRHDCPRELAYKANGKVVGCPSACDVFDTDAYCCRGVFGNPVTCQPTVYSKKFKEACPTAYSFAYDDPTSIFTCSGADYVVAFCLSRIQPVCTYHNGELNCSGSKGLNSLLGQWQLLMLASILFIAILRNIF